MTLRHFLRTTFVDRRIDWDIFVFLSYLIFAKIAQYILFELHSSPALIWAPVGIALAATMLQGPRMWLPISIAHFISIYTLNTQPLVVTLISTTGYTLQPIFGAYILKRLGSDGTIHRVRDVLTLILTSFFIALIGPIFGSSASAIANSLPGDFWLLFSRSWAGCVLGIILVTPFITGWYYSPSWPLKKAQRVEGICAFISLSFITYLLFWTTLASAVSFVLIFLLCAVLFWITFRFGSRVTTTSLMTLTIIAFAGTLMGGARLAPLNQQLFADELFMILITPIFYLFFTLMEERRLAEKRLEEKVTELQTMTERLSDADKAKNEFIAVLAHELRNPLSTIVTTLELLKQETVSTEMAGMIHQGELQTHTMRHLLDDLLDVARVSEKKFTILKEPVDINALIERSAHALQHLLTSRRQKLTVHLFNTRVITMIDPIRIEQVVVNLLSNAIKYTPPGGSIDLSCSIDVSTIVITVSDDGQGIPKEALEKIFFPFQQLHKGSVRSAGVGIGLFLARQIVDLHGGTIHATSTGAGKGSTFTVRLPLEITKTPDTTSGIQDILPGIRSLYKVLIVDDNEVAANGLAKLLSLKGYESMAVHSGKIAIEVCTAWSPDVVLLDLGLPDVHGLTVGKQIRALHGNEHPVLIALTGYGQAEDKLASLAAGFNYHITKPAGIAEIEALLIRINTAP